MAKVSKMRSMMGAVRRWFSVEYRLSIWCKEKQKHENYYAMNRRLMVRKSKTLNGQIWALYKRGPFGIGERVIDYSEWYN